MLLGVPRELKDGEGRVALLPAQVEVLSSLGVDVRLEHGAGVLSGASDAAYIAAGASVVSASEVWASDLLASGVRAFAFEDLHVSGLRPLLRPMSQVAGRSAAVTGAALLSASAGGSGILPGGVDGSPSATATVLGVGAAGEAAARSLSALGMRVTGVDTDEVRMVRLLTEGVLVDGVAPGGEILDEAVVSADLLVSSVLVPSQLAPRLVSADQVSRMRPGSVVVDVSIDQGGSVETSRPTSISSPTYVSHGVVHYCVPNIPGQFPRTASPALSGALMPYVAALASSIANGVDTTLHGSLAVTAGQMVTRS